MNANPGTMLAKTALSAAGSFFEALADASSLPAASPRPALVPLPNVAPRDVVESGNDDKTAANPTVYANASEQLPGPQPVLTADPAKSARPAPRQTAPTFSAAGGNRGATSEDQRPHLSSTALAAKIAAVVFLPPLPPIAPIRVAVSSTLAESGAAVDHAGSGRVRNAVPAEISASPVAAAVAAPVAQSAVDGNLPESNRESNAGASQVSATPAEDRSTIPAPAQAKTEGKSEASAVKPADMTNADARNDNNSEAAAAPQQTPAAQPAASAAGAAAVAQVLGIAPPPLATPSLPPIDILPAVESKTEPANKNAQTIKAVDANGVKDAGPSNANAAAKPASSQVAPANSSGAAAGSANQTGQHTQASASQPADAPSRSVDPGAAQAQSIAPQSSPRESAAHAQTDAPAAAARPSGPALPPQAGDAAPVTAINTAKLIQSMSQTEMRVGMHSSEFGEISIRTAVSQQQMTAQISVDHGDLASAISTHIPAMQEKLGGDTGLKALVEVSQGNMSFSGERGGSPSRQQPNQAAPARIVSTDASLEADQPVSRTNTWAVNTGYRLDIRA